jgi:hypothetical protein
MERETNHGTVTVSAGSGGGSNEEDFPEIEVNVEEYENRAKNLLPPTLTEEKKEDPPPSPDDDPLDDLDHLDSGGGGSSEDETKIPEMNDSPGSGEETTPEEAPDASDSSEGQSQTESQSEDSPGSSEKSGSDSQQQGATNSSDRGSNQSQEQGQSMSGKTTLPEIKKESIPDAEDDESLDSYIDDLIKGLEEEEGMEESPKTYDFSKFDDDDSDFEFVGKNGETYTASDLEREYNEYKNSYSHHFNDFERTYMKSSVVGEMDDLGFGGWNVPGEFKPNGQASNYAELNGYTKGEYSKQNDASGGGRAISYEDYDVDSHRIDYDIETVFHAMRTVIDKLADAPDMSVKDFGVDRWDAIKIAKSAASMKYGRISESKYERPKMADRMVFFCDVSGSVSHLASLFMSMIAGAAGRIRVVTGNEAHAEMEPIIPHPFPSAAVGQAYLSDVVSYANRANWAWKGPRDFEGSVTAYLKDNGLWSRETILVFFGDMQGVGFSEKELRAMTHFMKSYWFLTHDEHSARSNHYSATDYKIASHTDMKIFHDVNNAKGMLEAVRNIK